MISELINSKEYHLKPKWFLRQAGRHIPDYHLIRNKHKSFIDFCFEEYNVEATLPKYNIDAAICFRILKYQLFRSKVTFKKFIP